jgi:hypothetical protein
MTDERLPLADLLQKVGEGDFLRSVAQAVLQSLRRDSGRSRSILMIITSQLNVAGLIAPTQRHTFNLRRIRPPEAALLILRS